MLAADVDEAFLAGADDSLLLYAAESCWQFTLLPRWTFYCDAYSIQAAGWSVCWWIIVGSWLHFCYILLCCVLPYLEVFHFFGGRCYYSLQGSKWKVMGHYGIAALLWLESMQSVLLWDSYKVTYLILSIRYTTTLSQFPYWHFFPFKPV